MKSEKVSVRAQVYRTAVNYRGQCVQRLIRYQQFRWFHKRLDAKDAAQLRDAVFPQKKWTRSASLQDEVVEERQVMVRTTVLLGRRSGRYAVEL